MNLLNRLSLYLGVLGVMIALTACGGNDAVINSPISAPTISTGVIQATVIDSATGAAIQGAIIQSGGVSAATTATGAATLNNVPTGSSQINVSKTGYATNYRNVNVTNGGVYTLTIQALAVTTTPFNQSTANILSGGGASVNLTRNSLVDVYGVAATGQITANIGAIDPTVGFQTMPGQMTSGGMPLQSFGALTAIFTDSYSSILNLAQGQTATITIPVASGATAPPATMPLYFFDVATNQWIQQGTAALNGTSTAYVGSVSHFSYWNIGKTFNTATISGCVQDSYGNPLSGVEVEAQGNSYLGKSETTTDAAGNFTVPVMAGGTVLIWGENHQASPISNTNTVRTISGLIGTDTPLGACLVASNTTSSSTFQIKLTWGQNPIDLDSHLTGPIDAVGNRFHVYFGAITYPPTATATTADVNLDVDDVTSFGPEVITIRNVKAGTYQYSVHHFSGTSNIITSPTRVEVTLNGVLSIFTPPATGWAGLGDVWQVFTMTVDAAGNANITTLNTVVNGVGNTGVAFGVIRKRKPTISNWPW